MSSNGHLSQEEKEELAFLVRVLIRDATVCGSEQPLHSDYHLVSDIHAEPEDIPILFEGIERELGIRRSVADRKILADPDVVRRLKVADVVKWAIFKKEKSNSH